jgi:2-C-methyl-D-erythritol 4-phosphate cytidylyltransferase
MLVERLGARVYVVPGNPENRKITTAEDLRWAEWLLARSPVAR